MNATELNKVYNEDCLEGLRSFPDISIEKFDGLAVSSKVFICGMPIRLDSYKTCSFGCKYCFSNCRKIMEFKKELQVCNIQSVERTLEKVAGGEKRTLLQKLISQGITWHCGGMSDPFQPIEKKLGITRQLIDLTSQYGVSILFSTKSDSVYDCNINPELHTFQLSVTNVHNNSIEPNVPNIQKRYEFYRSLKAEGFKVGIRIQPFLPEISGADIVDMFRDADNFTIEGIKLVPQNEDMKAEILSLLGMRESQFTQKGLLALSPEHRLQLYEPVIARLKEYGIPYSVSDNDLRYLGTNKCCCGDRLVKNYSTMNPTYLLSTDGLSKKNMLRESTKMGISDCACDSLFTSNRTYGLKTIAEFINGKAQNLSCPFSEYYQYHEEPTLF